MVSYLDRPVLSGPPLKETCAQLSNHVQGPVAMPRCLPSSDYMLEGEREIVRVQVTKLRVLSLILSTQYVTQQK
jgi:hypothetical protein